MNELMRAALDKDRVGEWIQELWADDYHRFYLMSTGVDVHRVSLVDDTTLEVQYEFWDDEHHASDDQGCFLFDIDVGNEYGENFPQDMLHVLHTVRYSWESPEDRASLSKNLKEEDIVEQDLTYCDWNNPKIPDELVAYYMERSKNEYMRAMLLEKYDAAKGVPPFIPERLVPYFTKIIIG